MPLSEWWSIGADFLPCQKTDTQNSVTRCYVCMMLQVDQNWASQVTTLLCMHGFGYVWEMQSVGNNPLFIQRSTDGLFPTGWHASLTSNTEYSHCHPETLRASYIEQQNSCELRRAICLLRCNRLPLKGVSRFGNPSLIQNANHVIGIRLKICAFFCVGLPQIFLLM